MRNSKIKLNCSNLQPLIEIILNLTLIKKE